LGRGRGLHHRIGALLVIAGRQRHQRLEDAAQQAPRRRLARGRGGGRIRGKLGGGQLRGRKVGGDRPRRWFRFGFRGQRGAVRAADPGGTVVGPGGGLGKAHRLSAL